MNEVEVVCRECEPLVQVVDLQSVLLATALSSNTCLGTRGNVGDESHRTDDYDEKCDLRRALVISLATSCWRV